MILFKRPWPGSAIFDGFAFLRNSASILATSCQRDRANKSLVPIYRKKCGLSYDYSKSEFIIFVGIPDCENDNLGDPGPGQRGHSGRRGAPGLQVLRADHQAKLPQGVNFTNFIHFELGYRYSYGTCTKNFTSLTSYSAKLN